LITLAAYAKLRGYNDKTVRDAYHQKQITAVKKGRNYFVDPDVCDREWRENRRGRVDRQNAEMDPDFEEGQDSFAKARTDKERANAELAKLKLKKEQGSLLPRSMIERQSFEMARRIRNSILTIPVKVAPQVASEIDPHEVEVIIYRELNQALEDLSKLTSQDFLEIDDNKSGGDTDGKEGDNPAIEI